MTTPRVFILTAVHNGLKNTQGLLRCINEQDYKNIETYLVDDGSIDGTLEYIAKNYPKVNVIHGNGNLWWTRSLFEGVNHILVKASRNDFVLIVNNDCLFGTRYVTRLVEDGIKNKKAIVGSLIIDGKDKKSVWDAGIKVDWNRGRFYGLGPKLLSQIPRDKLYQKESDTLPTKGTLYPVEVFLKIGNFDKQNLPHYLSDYEFGIRAKRCGFKLLVSYKAKIYNDVKRTGLGDVIPARFSILTLFALFFSRKSKVNIVDQWNLTRIACPRKYKAKNYLLIFAKMVYYTLHVFPFSLIPTVIKFVKRVLGIENVVITKKISRLFGS